MKRLLIASVVMVGGLTGCAADRMDGRSEAARISGEFLLLLLVAVMLYLAFSGVVALVARRRSPRPEQSFDLVAGRAVPRATHAHSARHRRDRRRSAESGEGPDGAIPRDAPTGEPDRRRPPP
jgi:hypothetical protein